MATEQEHYQELARQRSRNIKKEKFNETQNDSRLSSSSANQSIAAQLQKSRLRREAARTVYKAASGSKLKAPFEAVSLGFKLRKQIKQGEGAAFEVAYAFAFAIDFADLVPFAGWMVTLFFKPALFIMLWGYGAWKLKLIRFVLIGLDLIPLVSKLPMSIISVAYTHHKMKTRKVKAEQELINLQKAYEDV